MRWKGITSSIICGHWSDSSGNRFCLVTVFEDDILAFPRASCRHHILILLTLNKQLAKHENGSFSGNYLKIRRKRSTVLDTVPLFLAARWAGPLGTQAWPTHHATPASLGTLWPPSLPGNREKSTSSCNFDKIRMPWYINSTNLDLAKYVLCQFISYNYM